MTDAPPRNDAYFLRKRQRHHADIEYEHTRRLRHIAWTKHLIDMNSDKCLSRTPANWGRLLLFYVLFWAGLVVLYATSQYVFRSNLSELVPRVRLRQPGFSLSPCVIVAGVCAIDYRLSNETEYFVYTDRINQTLQKYVDVDDSDRFGPCRWADEFGFAEGMPCLFLKVNRVIGFQARTYDRPTDVPDSELADYVDMLAEQQQDEKLWLSCQTDNVDVEVTYYPARFVHREVVYLRQKAIRRHHYVKTIHEDGSHVALNEDKIFYDRTDLERVVAVQLTRLPLDMRVLLTCYVWAANIERADRGYFDRGRIHLPITVRP